MENINIEEIIYKWFEMKLKTYDKLEHDGSIYLYDNGVEFADIVIDKNSKYIDYQWKLHEEFSDVFSMKRNEFNLFMVKWVGDTFGLKGFTPQRIVRHEIGVLKIPKINN